MESDLTKEQLVQRGKISGFDNDGKILVEIPEFENPLPCFFIRNTEGSRPQLNIGDQILFISNNKEELGYILGLIEPYYAHLENILEESHSISSPDDKIEVEVPGKLEKVHVNGKKISIEADDEIQLKCGKGTIIINKQGKIVVRGTNLISRSSGLNKIKGAAVSIN